MNKKILFITPALSKAGAETQLIKLANCLKTKNNEVLILSLLPKGDYEINVNDSGIKVVYLKSWKSNFISNIYQLQKTVKSFNPQVVIAFMFIAIIFARLLKIFFEFTLISSIRAAEIPVKWYLPFKLTSGLDDVVVYNANSSKTDFENQNLVKKAGVVINNAITIPTILENTHSNIKEKPFVWICVAHFRIEKDYMTLFKALALIKGRNFKINIIGHLFNQEWPFKIIEHLQIQDKVNLMGYKSNATEYLQEADAFVVSSFTESMPNAILEAMANQKPVVATAVGGVTELINSSACGYAYNQGEEYELASRMCAIMGMPQEERNVLGLNGRRYIESNFSERRVMEKWLNIINQYSNKKKVKQRTEKYWQMQRGTNNGSLNL